MGGDLGPRVVVPAALEALRLHPNLYLYIVGHNGQLESCLADNACGPEIARLHIVHASEVVAMDANPATVLRAGADTSMKLALEMLSQGQVAGVVSAGNTGALVALSRYYLGMCEGIDRAAICSVLPSISSTNSYLLDLGANINCQAANLQQFALMGTALVKALHSVGAPSVGLLNIGVEDNKGSEVVKAAAKLLGEDARINYAGYIEGSQLLEGRVDVLVTDGFVGNVALKVSEGTARFIADLMRKRLSDGFFASILAWLFRGFLQRFWRDIDPRGYNGGFFLGVDGVVVKSHGNSNTDSFISAIEQARICIDRNMVSLIKQELSS